MTTKITIKHEGPGHDWRSVEVSETSDPPTKDE